MSEEEKKTTEEVEVDSNELEKALDDALKSTEPLRKAKKAKAPEKEESFEDEDEDEDYEKSEDEPDFEKLSKSIPDTLGEDKDAGEVLDGMPFVKALVDTLEDQFVEMTKAVLHLSDKLETVEEKLAKAEKLNIAQAKLVKSISQGVQTIGGTSNMPKSFLGKNVSIMRKSVETGENGSGVEMKKSEVFTKLQLLVKSGDLDLQESIIAEGRINSGKPLQENVVALLTAK